MSLSGGMSTALWPLLVALLPLLSTSYTGNRRTNPNDVAVLQELQAQVLQAGQRPLWSLHSDPCGRAACGDPRSCAGNALTGGNTLCRVPQLCCFDYNVTGLILSNSSLAGTVPAFLSRMVNLQVLVLEVFMKRTRGSRLAGIFMKGSLDPSVMTGTLPEWSDWPSLLLLDLAFNDLRGTLPDSWSGMSNLQFLQLQSNALTGVVPAWSPWPSLRYADLSSNALRGTLPDAWADNTNLQFMLLGSNLLTGALPPSWGSLSRLQMLDLSFLSVTGSIPATWSGMANMEALVLVGDCQVCGPRLFNPFFVRIYEYGSSYGLPCEMIACNSDMPPGVGEVLPPMLPPSLGVGKPKPPYSSAGVPPPGRYRPPSPGRLNQPLTSLLVPPSPSPHFPFVGSSPRSATNIQMTIVKVIVPIIAAILAIVLLHQLFILLRPRLSRWWGAGPGDPDLAASAASSHRVPVLVQLPSLAAGGAVAASKGLVLILQPDGRNVCLGNKEDDPDADRGGEGDTDGVPGVGGEVTKDGIVCNVLCRHVSSSSQSCDTNASSSILAGVVSTAALAGGGPSGVDWSRDVAAGGWRSRRMTGEDGGQSSRRVTGEGVSQRSRRDSVQEECGVSPGASGGRTSTSGVDVAISPGGRECDVGDGRPALRGTGCSISSSSRDHVVIAMGDIQMTPTPHRAVISTGLLQLQQQQQHAAAATAATAGTDTLPSGAAAALWHAAPPTLPRNATSGSSPDVTSNSIAIQILAPPGLHAAGASNGSSSTSQQQQQQQLLGRSSHHHDDTQPDDGSSRAADVDTTQRTQHPLDSQAHPPPDGVVYALRRPPQAAGAASPHPSPTQPDTHVIGVVSTDLLPPPAGRPSPGGSITAGTTSQALATTGGTHTPPLPAPTGQPSSSGRTGTTWFSRRSGVSWFGRRSTSAASPVEHVSASPADASPFAAAATGTSAPALAGASIATAAASRASSSAAPPSGE